MCIWCILMYTNTLNIFGAGSRVERRGYIPGSWDYFNFSGNCGIWSYCTILLIFVIDIIKTFYVCRLDDIINGKIRIEPNHRLLKSNSVQCNTVK